MVKLRRIPLLPEKTDFSGDEFLVAYNPATNITHKIKGSLIAGSTEIITPDSAEIWNPAKVYTVGSIVVYSNPLNIDFEEPKLFRCLETTTAGQSPETHPAKWFNSGDEVEIISSGLANGVFSTNAQIANIIGAVQGNTVINIATGFVFRFAQTSPWANDANYRIYPNTDPTGVNGYWDARFFLDGYTSTPIKVNTSKLREAILLNDHDGINILLDSNEGALILDAGDITVNNVILTVPTAPCVVFRKSDGDVVQITLGSVPDVDSSKWELDGFRIPTEAEWNAERLSWNTNDAAGAFGSPLKLPVAGHRENSNGSLNNVGLAANYWSSTVNGTGSRYLNFAIGGAFSNFSSSRAYGYSIRLIKEGDFTVGTYVPETITIDDLSYNTVFNEATGKVWLDRNLGATQVATSSTDNLSYGDLYQWGRGTDGHEKRNSATTAILSATDQPIHGDFITANAEPYDWRSPQNDNLWQGLDGINIPAPPATIKPKDGKKVDASHIDNLPTVGGTTVEYKADSFTVIQGGTVTGTIADIQNANEGDVLRVNEAAGGLTVDFDFINVASFNYFTFHLQYVGGAGHEWQLELYNYDTLTWDVKSLRIGQQETLTYITVPIPQDAMYISGGEVKVRFNHLPNFITSHYLLVDYVGVISSLAVSETTAGFGLEIIDGAISLKKEIDLDGDSFSIFTSSGGNSFSLDLSPAESNLYAESSEGVAEIGMGEGGMFFQAGDTVRTQLEIDSTGMKYSALYLPDPLTLTDDHLVTKKYVDDNAGGGGLSPEQEADIIASAEHINGADESKHGSNQVSNSAALANIESAASATLATINGNVNARLFEQIGFALTGYGFNVTTTSQDVLTSLPYAFKAYELRAEFATAPTDSSAIVTFYKNGVSIGTVTILATEFFGVTVLDPIVSFAKGDTLSARVTFVGVGVPGATAKAYIQGIKYQ